ncbi:hypothetical protein Bbelb_021770 [Branchiostoma belcheri]|nr:hypothetical protein Bbelb_021770 [Branchiostoma belcheri]
MDGPKRVLETVLQEKDLTCGMTSSGNDYYGKEQILAKPRFVKQTQPVEDGPPSTKMEGNDRQQANKDNIIRPTNLENTTATSSANVNQVDSLEEWSRNAGLKLNPDKCMTLTVCFMKNPPPPLPITLNGSVLKSVYFAKVLGLWLQSNLKWNKQISESTKKASKRLFMLRKLRAFCLPVADLVTVYCGFIRPVLEYCAPVWHHSLTHQQAATIEQVQKRACRTILGKHYTDYASALQQCGLETLENRRVNLCRKFAVSMEKSERTADLLPPARGQSTRRELRNSTKRTLPITRENEYLLSARSLG